MTAQIVTFARSAHAVQDDVRSLPGATIAYAPGEEIYAQAEETDLIYRVISGAVRTTRLDSDGRRQIGDFYYAGDFFGLEAGPEHRFSAEALCDAQVQVFKRTSLAMADDTVSIERMIWTATARELERTREHLMMLGRKTAREKVASFLYDVADRQGGEIQTLTMGRQDMADYLGLTIETVSRMLTQLQTEGLVTFIGCRQFRIGNRSALTRLVAA
ncbi:MAG: helix-turn-helix domain-containing protein [Caulobacter sp.]|nr:helix-turn-helix domain-containing protein [Caulobacter sp.]